MHWLLQSTQTPIIILVVCALAIFYLGYLTGKYLTKGLPTNPMYFSQTEWARIGVVLLTLGVFSMFLWALYTQIFMQGVEVPLSLMVMGIYSFGSLVGEKDFLSKVIDRIRK